jgi:OFA family oxalate/formate antiporter-like MFS transporter
MSTAGEIAGRNVNSIIGILYTSVAIGTLVGPSAAGFVFDVSHSYTLPILARVAANIVAAGIAALATGASLRTTATGQHTRQ